MALVAPGAHRMDVPSAPTRRASSGGYRPRRRRLPRRADPDRRALSTSLPARHDGAGDHVDGAGRVARRRGRAPGRPLARRARVFGDPEARPDGYVAAPARQEGRLRHRPVELQVEANPSSTAVACPLSGPSTGQGTARRPDCPDSELAVPASTRPGPAPKALGRAHTHTARGRAGLRGTRLSEHPPPETFADAERASAATRSSGANGSPPATFWTTRGRGTCKGVH